MPDFSNFFMVCHSAFVMLDSSRHILCVQTKVATSIDFKKFLHNEESRNPQKVNLKLLRVKIKV